MNVDLPFKITTYAERYRRVLERMSAEGMDVLLVNLPDNIFYLSGHDAISYLWYQCLVISPQLSGPVFLTREFEEPIVWHTSVIEEAIFYDIITDDPIARLSLFLQQNNLESSRIGLELDAFTFLPSQYLRLREHLPRAEFVNASTLVAAERVVKSPEELAYQRQAAEMADYAMAVAMEALRPGITEAQLAGIIQQALGEVGSEQSAIPPLVQAGSRTSMGHALPRHRPILRGDLVLIEFAGVRYRYHAPILRTAFIGNPPEKLVEDYACVQEAHSAAIRSARAGVPATEPNRVANEILAKRGLDVHRLGRIGYSIGIAYAPTWLEPLVLSEPDPAILEANMSFTIEPVLKAIKEDWGIKLGDTVLCTDQQGESLTRFPCELYVIP